jgi:peroxiredoxin family protein
MVTTLEAREAPPLDELQLLQPVPRYEPEPQEKQPERSDASRLAIIALHGTLDMAYPPLILAAAAASMCMEATIFFTFYGLDIVKKGRADKLKVAPIANPAMPVPVPNIVGVLPGMTYMATAMMKNWMKKANVTRLSDLLGMAQEMGVKMIACQMSMDVMGIKKEDLIDGVEVGGAATFLEFASHNAIALTF